MIKRSYSHWQPEWRTDRFGQPAKREVDRDDLPDGPIAVTLGDRNGYPGADDHILYRAIMMNGLVGRVFETDPRLREEPGCRELVDYRIEYRASGETTVLPRPYAGEAAITLPMEEGTRRRVHPDEITVVAKIVDGPGPAWPT
ncbi:MAG: hypothetical protein OXG35_07075 [Acidobacteria bacterium]|nr:hypothetical protein [Acidobacteriota bacterium]